MGAGRRGVWLWGLGGSLQRSELLRQEGSGLRVILNDLKVLKQGPLDVS